MSIAAPSPPTDVFILELANNEILLQWKPSEHLNGPKRMFIVVGLRLFFKCMSHLIMKHAMKLQSKLFANTPNKDHPVIKDHSLKQHL